MAEQSPEPNKLHFALFFVAVFIGTIALAFGLTSALDIAWKVIAK